jgi:hypothetical protein
VGFLQSVFVIHVRFEVFTAVSDYEERRLVGYINPVGTSQETHYVSATEHSWLSFEVFTAVTMKSAVFWGVTLCGYCKNRRS